MLNLDLRDEMAIVLKENLLRLRRLKMVVFGSLECPDQTRLLLNELKQAKTPLEGGVSEISCWELPLHRIDRVYAFRRGSWGVTSLRLYALSQHRSSPFRRVCRR